MRTDDARHGTTRGYAAGCRCEGCRKARARDEKARRLDKLRGGRAVPALGTQRRIQALMRLGWTTTEIAHAAGWTHRNRVRQILVGQKGKPCSWVERSTHTTIARIYDELSMRLPEDGEHPQIRTKTRQRAEAEGWPPPLAWDDIDNDPTPPAARDERRGYDHAAVERRYNGDRTVRVTNEEAAEVVRRALRAGRSTVWIETNLGLKPERYARQEVAA